MKIIRRLSERNLFVLALFWTIAITVASLISVGEMPKVDLPGNDKTIHFLFYFVLTLLWYVALERKYKNRLLKFLIVGASIIYGIIIEILQGVLTQNRQADVYDALTEGKADAALAASLFHYKELEIADLKDYLAGRGVPVRR